MGVKIDIEGAAHGSARKSHRLEPVSGKHDEPLRAFETVVRVVEGIGAQQAAFAPGVAAQAEPGEGDRTVQKLHHSAGAGVLGDAICSLAGIQGDLPDLVGARQGARNGHGHNEAVIHGRES